MYHRITNHGACPIVVETEDGTEISVAPGGFADVADPVRIDHGGGTAHWEIGPVPAEDPA